MQQTYASAAQSPKDPNAWVSLSEKKDIVPAKTDIGSREDHSVQKPGSSEKDIRDMTVSEISVDMFTKHTQLIKEASAKTSKALREEILRLNADLKAKDLKINELTTAKQHEIEALTKSKQKEVNRYQRIVNKLAAEKAIAFQEIEYLNQPVQTTEQLKNVVVAITEKFQSLEKTIVDQKLIYNTDADSSTKMRAVVKEWAPNSAKLKLLAIGVEKLFTAHAKNNPENAQTLNELNKSWNSVNVLDYKIEKSKQHFALKQKLKAFLTDLEDSRKGLEAEVNDLIANKYTTSPGIVSGHIYWHIGKDQKDIFATFLKMKQELISQLDTKAFEKQKKLKELIKEFNLSENNVPYLRKLAAGDYELADKNIEIFAGIRNELSKEETILYTNLFSKWEEYSVLYSTLCHQMAILESGLTDPELTFRRESGITSDKEKLMKLSPAIV